MVQKSFNEIVTANDELRREKYEITLKNGELEKALNLIEHEKRQLESFHTNCKNLRESFQRRSQIEIDYVKSERDSKESNILKIRDAYALCQYNLG